jgi:hypothetical protein
MTRIAQLIAKREGFGKPGTIPTVRHNPGDLRHSPHSSHDGIGPNDIGKIDTDTDGWADEERQLRLYADRGLTLRQAIESWAPAKDGNDPAAYLQFVLEGLADTPLHELLKVLTA